MRDRYGEQLNRLNTELITMGALCEEAISGCVQYLIENDTDMRDKVIDADRQIDQKERDIEQLCIKLLMRQQPVAGDLRAISAALKMISDMERIGDQAFDIAEIVKHIDVAGEMASEIHLKEMAKATIKMVTDSVNSFVRQDVELARSVIKHDSIVDGLFDKVKGELIEAVRSTSENAEASIDFLMIAKYFERIGDHAENIAGWVIYSVTGEHEA